MNMEMDYIAKVVILLAGIAVVLGLIYSISSNIRKRTNFLEQEESNSLVIRGSFSQADINKYIEMCRQKSLSEPGKSIACYILKGTFDMELPMNGVVFQCAKQPDILIIEYEPSLGIVVSC